jgi:hypothetical protein
MRLGRRSFLDLSLAGLIGGLFGTACAPARPAAEAPSEQTSGHQTGPAAAARTGAPVAILTTTGGTNPFGAYLAEIMRAEGLNLFETHAIADASESLLARFSLVILAEGPLASDQARLLDDFVVRGGSLVAMRPDPLLDDLLGIERAEGTTTDGYLKIDSTKGPGAGLPTIALQFHGEACRFRARGAEVLATLYGGADTATPFAAVTVNQHGAGRSAMWAFDLARSVALTRQGNPRWANEERDGLADLSAVDMFVGWVDPERVPIAQADEEQRLFTNLIRELLANRFPLPQLWHLPGGCDGLLVVTGDAHGNPAPFVEDVIARVERHGGRMTLYYAPYNWQTGWLRNAAREVRRRARGIPIIGPRIPDQAAPTPQEVAEWRARGHELTVHPYVEDGVETGYRRYIELFESVGYAPISRTVRTHRVLWTGWVETARVQSKFGIRMNTDYYHMSPALRDAAGRWVFGHLTGGTVPMRQIDEAGEIIPVYQQPTQLVDEHLLKVWWWPGPQLSGDQAVEVSRDLIDRAIDRGYGPIVAQFHADLFNPADAVYADECSFVEGTLDHAVKRGVPIWTAERWLAFVEARAATVVTDLEWSADVRQFTFRVAGPERGGLPLEVRLPFEHLGLRVGSATVDGVAVAIRRRALPEAEYVFVPLATGKGQVSIQFA